MENGKLNAVIKPLNTLSTQRVTFDFSKDKVKLSFKGTPSFIDFIMKNADKSSFIKKSGAAKPMLMKTVLKALEATERPMTFKSK